MLCIPSACHICGSFKSLSSLSGNEITLWLLQTLFSHLCSWHVQFCFSCASLDVFHNLSHAEMGNSIWAVNEQRHIIRAKKRNTAKKGLVVLCHFHNRNVALTTDSLNTGWKRGADTCIWLHWPSRQEHNHLYKCCFVLSPHNSKS